MRKSPVLTRFCSCMRTQLSSSPEICCWNPNSLQIRLKTPSHYDKYPLNLKTAHISPSFSSLKKHFLNISHILRPNFSFLFSIWNQKTNITSLFLLSWRIFLFSTKLKHLKSQSSIHGSTVLCKYMQISRPLIKCWHFWLKNKVSLFY